MVLRQKRSALPACLENTFGIFSTLRKDSWFENFKIWYYNQYNKENLIRLSLMWI